MISLNMIADRLFFQTRIGNEKLQNSNNEQTWKYPIALVLANLVEGGQVEVPSHVHELNLNPVLSKILRIKMTYTLVL